jgi:hypothetical protein
MRANPRDWHIADVKTICHAFGLRYRKPGSGSSHATISHPSRMEILTVVSPKPVKAVYIVKLVSFIDSVLESES